MKLAGTMTAMVTPFTEDGARVDHARLAAHVQMQIEKGVDGLVPVGTTGESPTLPHAEHREVVQRVVEAAAGRTAVIAGTGSNSTAEALALTEHAKQVGADAALVVNPYYNKPTQEGQYRHFMQIADLGLPIVLYNIPGRTAVGLEPATIERLAAHPKIVAIKEATGSMDVASEILHRCGPDAISILSGDDSLTLPLMALGARGVVSVLSNLVPDRVKSLTTAALAGDFLTAQRIHHELFALFKGMFVETNPIPIKTAMAMVGLDRGVLRPPMCELSSAHRADLERLLRDHGIPIAATVSSP